MQGVKSRGIMLMALVLGAAAPGLCAEVTEVKVCSVLPATRSGAALNRQTGDSARIQQALELCNPGEAVVLKNNGANNAFLSAPLVLPRGVTLFVQKGVTVYASAERQDYDLWPGSCGVPASTKQGCKPLLFSYQAAYSGIKGGGTIDGRGEKWRSFQAEAKRLGRPVSVPDLVSSYESQEFSVRGLTLKNAAGTMLAIYKTIRFAAEEMGLNTKEGSGEGVLLSNSPKAHCRNWQSGRLRRQSTYGPASWVEPPRWISITCG